MFELEGTGEGDDVRIDVRDEKQLECWANKLKIPKDQFKRAAEQAGPRIGDIRQHLVGGFTRGGPTS